MTVVEIDGREAGLYAHLAHFVTGHPQCGVLHGHSVSLGVRISSKTRDKFGFVVDFSVVKRALKEILASIDHHGLIVGSRNVTINLGNRCTVANGDFYYDFPPQHVTALPIPDTTAESMAEWALGELRARLPSDDANWLETIELTYYETRSTGATVRWERKEQ